MGSPFLFLISTNPCYFFTVVLLTTALTSAVTFETVLLTAVFTVADRFAAGVLFVTFATGAVSLHSPRKSAHSSHDEPFGKEHMPYSFPCASFLISSFPPTWPQYTEAGLASPEAFSTGAAVVTTTCVVGTGVATVVAGVVAGWLCVHPAVIMTTAIIRTSNSVEVFIQLIKISPAHIWAGKLYMHYGLIRRKSCGIVHRSQLKDYALIPTCHSITVRFFKNGTK